MPIKGVSEVRRLPRIGKVRLGERLVNPKSGKEYAKAADYFVVREDELTPKWAVEAFREVYGDKPRLLDIILPTEDRDKVFSQFLRGYGTGGILICKGDGERANRVNPETGELMEIDCNPETCEMYQTQHCRRTATLFFILPKVRGLGVWQLDTGSFHSIVNINSALDMIQAVCGRISWIPLKLQLEQRQVAPDRKSKKKVWVLNIVQPDITFSDLMRMAALAEAERPRAALAEVIELPKPDDRPPEDLYPNTIMEGGYQPEDAEEEPAPAGQGNEAAPEPPAQPAPEQPKFFAEPSSAQPRRAGRGIIAYCADCRKAIRSQQIHDYAMARYGQPLCYACQDKRTRGAAKST